MLKQSQMVNKICKKFKEETQFPDTKICFGKLENISYFPR